MAAPFVAIVAACCDGVNASEIGRSKDPTRGPLAFGALVAPVVPVTLQAASTRPAASAHPNGPRRVLRMSSPPHLPLWKRPYHIALDTDARSEEHTSELQSRRDLVCRLLLEKKKKK